MSAAIAVALLLAQAVPNAVSDPVVLGLGANRCGKWIADKDENNEVFRVGFITWLSGYLSGAQAISASDPVDMGTATAWVDAYCARHMLDDVSTAAEAFVQAYLAHRKRQ